MKNIMKPCLHVSVTTIQLHTSSLTHFNNEKPFK